MRSQMAQINMMSSSTSSQRILKVVNIIGSKNTNKDGQLSSKRVSHIRARQYKSKGEKVTFRHTPSREKLLTSQELALASGFQHVQLGPEMLQMMDYPMMNNVAAGNTDGRMSALSSEFATGRKTKKSRGARKNHLLLSNQGGGRGGQRTAAQTSNAFYNPGSYSNNLNKLLDEMDKQDE